MHSLDKQGYNLQVSKFIHFGNSLVQLTNAIDLAKNTKSLLMLPNMGTCELVMRLINFYHDFQIFLTQAEVGVTKP